MLALRITLVALALTALEALILGTPVALSAEVHCTTRPLDQGSGSVRICEVRR